MIKIKNTTKPPLYSSPIHYVKDEKKETIKTIALASLKELAIGLAFAGVACLFTTTPAGIAIAVGGVVTIVALNTLIRGSSLSFSKRLHEIESIETPKAQKEKKFLRLALKVFNVSCASNFSIAYLGTAGIVVHEAGHAAAASLLTTGSFSITVNPFRDGLTKYLFNKLSSIGNRLGFKETRLIMSAAGALFTLIASITFFIAAHYLQRSHPNIALYLNTMGIWGVLSESIYAMQALMTQNSSNHDFLALRQGGIHPLISVAILIGLPLLVKGMLLLADHLLKQTPQLTAAVPLRV